MKHSRLRLRSSRSALAAAILIFGAGSLSTAAPAFAQDAMSPSPGTPVASGLAEPIRDEGRRGDDVPVLDGASDKVAEMMSDADERLSALSGGALPNADVSGHQSDLDVMSAIQRDIQILQLQSQKAELATALWKTLYEMENSPGEKDKEQTADSDDLLPHQSAGTTSLAQPVVAQPAVPEPPKVEKSPALPVIVSLSGVGDALRANLLIPYKGEVTAQAGDVLPNGMRVVTMSSSGVVVRDGKKTFALGFGSEVPSAPPPPPMVFPVGFAGAPGMMAPGAVIPPLGTVMPHVPALPAAIAHRPASVGN